MGNNKRLIYIDYLKVLGLFLVILAHVNCPNWLMQIRSFDVPLLVFLSGFLANKTYKNGKPRKYYLKRLTRLAVPAWIFVLLFFSAQIIFYTKPSSDAVLKALLFQKDANMVGMLWVIWVYLACAFIIPIIDRIQFNRYNIGLFVLAYVIFDVVCKYSNIENSRLLYNTVLTVVPWGTLTFFAYNYEKISFKNRKLIALCMETLFIIFAVYYGNREGHFVLSNDYKYPAQSYYFLYAIPVIILLFELCKRLDLKNNRFIKFVSASSLWIYLWHILLLYVVKMIIFDDSYWIIQYFVIIVSSILVTYIQNRIVHIMIDRFGIKCFKVFLG